MRRHALLVAPLLMIEACSASIPPLARPIPTIGWDCSQPRRSERLVVLLPGRYSPPEEFREHGVEEEVQRALGPVDVIAADAHIGYYLRGDVEDMLAADILEPARDAGFREIWIVGVSMGGSGALAALRTRPDLVSGVVLLGPFLGSDEVLSRVKRYGPDMGLVLLPRDSTNTFFEDLWAWLEDPSVVHGPILLGFGKGDRYVEGDRLLAGLLPPARVVEVDGGHDWGAWRRAAAELLRRGLPAR